MTTGDQLNADVEQYLLAAASNTPPPVIVSDPVIPGVTPIEQLMGVMVLAANARDPEDNAQSADEHATRDAKLTDAAAKFSAQDEAAQQELNSVAQQADPALAQAASPTGAAVSAPAAAAAEPASAMAQQLPQAASSIAGAMSGALGGALQPLGQIPQQVAQGAQQVMQTGMGLFQQAGGAAAASGAVTWRVWAVVAVRAPETWPGSRAPVAAQAAVTSVALARVDSAARHRSPCSARPRCRRLALRRRRPL